MAIGSPQWMYASGEAYTLDQSLKLDEDKVSYLSRTPASAGNRKTWTFSCWVKRGTLGVERAMFGAGLNSGQPNANFGLYFFTDDCIRVWTNGGNAAFRTTAKYRDTSAWYHVVLKSSTVSPYFNLYVNGAEVTDFSLDQRTTYPSTNDTEVNQADTVHYVGGWKNGDYSALAGYMAEVNFIDGTALTASSFGETGDYGEWKPIEYSGTYGTNGFYLPFKNDYTVEGFSVVTYKGSASEHYIGGVGFSPDLVWTKSTSTAGKQHILVDTVRGGNSNFMSDSTAEASSASNRQIALGASDGYVINSNSGHLNESDKTYVSWNWDMGADTPTGFGCVTYKGTGSSMSITGMGFKPDLVWIKRRNGNGSHRLTDAVRGIGNELSTDGSGAEYSGSDTLAFESDGFRNGGNSDDTDDTYVAWGWNMGGTSVANTSGSTNSTVMANTTYGQSIVTYSGQSGAQTVGHGLSSTPEMIIVKNRSSAQEWLVYHANNTAAPETDYLRLDTTAATADNTFWNDTAPTSTVFSVGDSQPVNSGHGNDYVAYCFHSVTGYSKCGTYDGDGTTNGSHAINLGFRPAWVMIKCINDAESWWIWDNQRNQVRPNATNNRSAADSSGAETTNVSTGADYIEFTATGFKHLGGGGGANGSGNSQKYVYLAFAGGLDSIAPVNTTGDIDARVKVNSTYGQSIVRYAATGTTGHTVGHGLGGVPDALWFKSLTSQSWNCFFPNTSLGATKGLQLDNGGAQGTVAHMNNTMPTTSVFSLGANQASTNAFADGVGQEYMVYCWKNVAGYSSIGTYTGNGSSTGPSVTTGFKPAWVMIKNASTTDNSWFIYDTTRNPTNRANNALAADTSAAEANYSVVDFDSNGFQIHGTYGFANDNGDTYVYMAFADKREYAYWLDQSGNNNDWTSNNLTESDISVDSPTNNFATWNPLQAGDAGSLIGTLSEGNLKHYLSGSGQALTMGTIAPTTGKWYCEFTIGDPSGAGSDRSAVGIGDVYDVDIQGSGNADKTVMVSTSTANRVWLTDNVESDNNFPARTTGSIIQFAWDMDNSKVWIGVNNQWCNSSGAVIPKSDVEAGNNATVTDTGLTSVSPLNRWSAGSSITQTHYLNCGQDSSFSGNKTAQGNQDSNEIGDFYYTPPTGFLALCTSNLPDATVTPSEHFNTVLYSGNDADDRSISVGFQPDFVWLKIRTQARNHYLYDAVRGADKQILTNATNAEQTTADRMQAFESNGFQLGTSSEINDSGETFVSWSWKANGSGSSNTDGSINSTATSASVDGGFSIVTYTGNATEGATVGHGLSKAPEVIMLKKRSGSSGWYMYHSALGATKNIEIQVTSAAATTANIWNDTAPTSSVFSLGNNAAVNGNNATFVAYCFHSVDGYSKVGSYTGNGNADGPFVYTGFRPAYVLTKVTNAADDWSIADSSRSPDNVAGESLRPNSNSAEDSAADIDILSNGFKVRQADSHRINYDGDTFIYLAFAEIPFKNSNAR